MRSGVCLWRYALAGAVRYDSNRHVAQNGSAQTSTHKNQKTLLALGAIYFGLAIERARYKAYVSELEHRDLAKNQKLQLKSTSLLLQRNNSNYTARCTDPGQALKSYARV